MDVTLALRKVGEADPSRGWVKTEYYDIVVRKQVVGEIQLRLADNDNIRLYAGHVGYGVKPQHQGHGYASAALKELATVARAHGFRELWITCEAHNVASCRTLDSAGASFEGTVLVPTDSDLYARGLTMRRYRLSV